MYRFDKMFKSQTRRDFVEKLFAQCHYDIFYCNHSANRNFSHVQIPKLERGREEMCCGHLGDYLAGCNLHDGTGNRTTDVVFTTYLKICFICRVYMAEFVLAKSDEIC